MIDSPFILGARLAAVSVSLPFVASAEAAAAATVLLLLVMSTGCSSSRIADPPGVDLFSSVAIVWLEP